MNTEPNIKIRKELIDLYNNNKYELVISKIIELQVIFSKSIFLLNLLGVTYNVLENFDAAIVNFKKIIKINSNFADAYYNLGNIYKKIGNKKESINNYNICIQKNSRKFEAFNNLGNIYKENGNIQNAIDQYLECLEINPNYLIALQNFGVCLQNFKFFNNSSKIDKYIILLLQKDRILRPVDIMDCVIDYLYKNPKLNYLLKNLKKLKTNIDLDKLINDISNNNLLIELLKITPITDLNIEKLLRFIRSEILINNHLIKDKASAINVTTAIALQCYLNEYIYPVGDKEKIKINKIEKKLHRNLLNKDFKKDYLEIASLSSYKPLNRFSWSDKLLDCEDIYELVKQQIIEPNYEQILRSKIDSKAINNKISLQVKDQYENNPYPRWTKIALNSKPLKPIDYFNKVNLNYESKIIKNWSNVNILVAGCGTGQHALTTASKYKNSFVTAIDLSSKSLSYAKRKAEEYKIKNIEFIQMDILDLIDFKKKFEIIECVGVLHHMSKPIVGWEILSNRLCSNGLMMIGLYSMYARKHIINIRNEIKKSKIEINIENIRSFREHIINSKLNDKKLITKSSDFYTLSNIRDLLFHVQESRFTLLEIKKCLQKLNLKFCGFESRTVLEFFKKNNEDKKNLYNLEVWDKLEITNQRIFANMYQFWCQKN